MISLVCRMCRRFDPSKSENHHDNIVVGKEICGNNVAASSNVGIAFGPPK